MSTITRRKLVGQAAALAGATTVANAAITSAAPGTSATSNRAPAQEKTEIILYHIWGTPPGGTPAATPAPMTQVIEAFNKQSTTAVIKDQTPGNYYETLQKTQADIAAGNPPDLVSVPWAFLDYAVEGLGVRALGDIAGEGFADLQTMMKPDAWPLVTKDDVIYGFPWGLSTPILYYNADIFEQAGVDPATAFDTWESFAAACPALQEVLGGNPVLALSYNKDWPAQTIIQSNGGRVLKDDGTFGITSNETKEAMQTIADLDKSGFYDRGTREELRPNFIAGSNAVWQASVASLGGLSNDATFTFGTSTWPKFGDKPVQASTGGSFLGSFTQDESKFPAIVEFLQFCASEEGYGLWNQTGYINISNIELPQLEGQEPAYAQFEAGLIRETNWPGPRGVEAGSTWDVYCERMWANDISVEEGTEAALEEITAIIGA
jgi:multiple sugar transport system substrate-binding protein